MKKLKLGSHGFRSSSDIFTGSGCTIEGEESRWGVGVGRVQYSAYYLQYLVF
jgi:hypothetical protein